MTGLRDPGMSVDCATVVEIITGYLEGTLDADMRQRVEAHLALCDGCDNYLEQMRQTIRALGRVPLETLSDDAKTALLDAFRTRPR